MEYVRRKYSKKISQSTAYNIFHRLNYTKTRPKKKNKKANPEVAEEFRGEMELTVAELDEDTIIMYEDEAIFTSEPTVCAMWTKKGDQGIVPTSGETRKRTVIFGAVNPEGGDLYEQFSDVANTETFKEFMLRVSRATLPKKVIMPTDNATYHHFKGIAEWWAENIPNIKLMYLPSHCSDLNAIELLWKNIRTAVTHNTLFENINSTISHLKSYIAELKNHPLQEQEVADEQKYGKYCFVSSWTEEESESIPMWKIYTNMESGIRIKLPIYPFKEYIIDANDIPIFVDKKSGQS